MKSNKEIKINGDLFVLREDGLNKIEARERASNMRIGGSHVRVIKSRNIKGKWAVYRSKYAR